MALSKPKRRWHSARLGAAKVSAARDRLPQATQRRVAGGWHAFLAGSEKHSRPGRYLPPPGCTAHHKWLTCGASSSPNHTGNGVPWSASGPRSGCCRGGCAWSPRMRRSPRRPSGMAVVERGCRQRDAMVARESRCEGFGLGKENKVTAAKSPQRLARSPASRAPSVTYARPRANDPRN